MKASFIAVFFVLCLSGGPVLSFDVAQAASESPESLEDIGSAWEEQYVNDARLTIEKGVNSVMNGLTTPEQLSESVDYFCRTWSDWADSKLFILQDDRDIDVYGNLYSLQVICRTLHLAAEDWHEVENSSRSYAVLEKALWLEEQSRLLADPVAEIISRQSYSAYLPRRVEIMKEQFPYVDEFYKQHSFRSVLP